MIARRTGGPRSARPPEAPADDQLGDPERRHEQRSRQDRPGRGHERRVAAQDGRPEDGVDGPAGRRHERQPVADQRRPERQALAGGDHQRDPGERDERTGELDRVRHVGARGHRQQRGDHRRRGDEQCGVAGRDRLERDRPEDLVAAEADDAQTHDPQHVAVRDPEGALAHPQQGQEGDRGQQVAEEREADRRQDADGALDDDEVARPEDHDDQHAELGHPAVAEIGIGDGGGGRSRAAGQFDARRSGGRLMRLDRGIDVDQAPS